LEVTAGMVFALAVVAGCALATSGDARILLGCIYMGVDCGARVAARWIGFFISASLKLRSLTTSVMTLRFPFLINYDPPVTSAAF
jgi:hypothetical protein